MKVALDTNVLVSAYTTRGLSSDVFRLILTEHELVLSEPVLGEFERVLIGKFGVPAGHVALFVQELRLHEIAPTPLETDTLAFIHDPDDRFVVAAALNAGTASLITADLDILDVRGQIPELAVYTPREFWKAIRSGGQGS